MRHHRFTLPLRYQLQGLHEAKTQNAVQDIAQQLGFHVSTIRRELHRATPYTAEAAHQQALIEQGREGASRRGRPLL